MNFYRPFFSVIIIVIQLVLSLISYYEFIAWGKENPELNALILRIFNGGNLFLFVLSIGFYEMLTKPSLFKTCIRIFLICLVLGTQFGYLIPIDDFYSGVYNTAWFSAVVAFILSLFKIIKK